MTSRYCWLKRKVAITDISGAWWLQLLGPWMPHATVNRSTEALLPIRIEFGAARVPSHLTLWHRRMPTGGANWMRSLWAGWKRRRGERGCIRKWMVQVNNQVLDGHGQALIMWSFFGGLAPNGQRCHHILYQECCRAPVTRWSSLLISSILPVHKRTSNSQEDEHDSWASSQPHR